MAAYQRHSKKYSSGILNSQVESVNIFRVNSDGSYTLIEEIAVDKKEKEVNQEYNVYIGGRLVAIVNASSSAEVMQSISTSPVPSNPTVPKLRLNRGVASNV